MAYLGNDRGMDGERSGRGLLPMLLPMVDLGSLRAVRGLFLDDQLGHDGMGLAYGVRRKERSWSGMYRRVLRQLGEGKRAAIAHMLSSASVCGRYPGAACLLEP